MVDLTAAVSVRVSVLTLMMHSQHSMSNFKATDKLEWVLSQQYKVFKASIKEDPFENTFALQRDFVGRSYEHEEQDERDSDSDW